MDHERFDDLTRALATSTSRRQFLKTLAASTFGGLLGLSGLGTVFGAPNCHRNGLGCDTNSQCCSGFCQNEEKCTCPPAPACTTPPNNTCPCPSGQTCLNGTCCATSQVCNGVCCSSGQTCCSGQCKDLSTDVNNCGSCGTTCTETPSACCSGSCCHGSCCFGFCCPSVFVCCPNGICGPFCV